MKNGIYSTKLGNVKVKNNNMELLKTNGEVSKRKISSSKLIENVLSGKSWKNKKSILGI